MLRLFLITLLVVSSTISASAADDVVWQLRFNDGQPLNCALALTRVAKDEKGQTILESDTSRDKSVWHSCLTLPKGLLKAGKDYVVILDYEVIGRSGADSYFYVFGRSDRR